MRFIDEVTLFASSGHGGAGCIAFRHEKFIEFGGPSGGDGGKGGDVIFVASSGLSTLLELRHRPHQKAEKGHNGQGKNRHGAGGEDLVITVPVGTVISDAETGEQLADMNQDGMRVVLLKGGRGGQGNARFASATNKAPKFAQPGGEEEERKLRLPEVSDFEALKGRGVAAALPLSSVGEPAKGEPMSLVERFKSNGPSGFGNGHGCRADFVRQGLQAFGTPPVRQQDSVAEPGEVAGEDCSHAACADDSNLEMGHAYASLVVRMSCEGPCRRGCPRAGTGRPPRPSRLQAV